MFKLLDIARLEKEIKTWNHTTSSWQRIAVIQTLKNKFDWFTINYFKQKSMNYNNNRLHDRVINCLCSSKSYKEKNHSLHT